jgi:preprotein translocase subunit Sec63
MALQLRPVSSQIVSAISHMMAQNRDMRRSMADWLILYFIVTGLGIILAFALIRWWTSE